jgi:putative CocE/NonD family hydrolase
MALSPKILLALIAAGFPSSAATAADYTNEQLAALIENPELRHLDLPFLDAPKPDVSLYIEMPDGVRLATSLYFPAGFNPKTDTAPAVFEDSIYGRAEDASTTAIDLYRRAGFVVVIGDARGFAASFGSQQGFNTSQQTVDEADVIAWVASQPWSDGKVAAIGHSVSAVFADSMTGSGASALKAAIIRASDFDEYANNMFPGGAPNLGILALAGDLMAWHAGGDCSVDLAACGQLGFMPVDGDDTFELLQAAIRDHKGNVAGDQFSALVYRDDVFGTMNLGQSGGIARLDGIRTANTPARVIASWMDGVTALSALDRFEMAPSVPMEVVIGATTHPGGLNADPFETEPFSAASPSAVEQFAGDVDFVRRVLAGETIGRSISYVVLGTDTWKRTDVWPPVGVVAQRKFLSPQRLTAEIPDTTSAGYTVDPNSTSGMFNRWAAQRGKPIFYGDLRSAPGKRLSFDMASEGVDQELVGTPELCLNLSSDQKDGIVIAYLEDVAPDGRVTYLTEGILRLLHRETAGTACDPAPGANRSFERTDGAAVVPGEMMRLELPLYPVAAMVRAGHHLRLSLAGADAGWFDGLTGNVAAKWTVAFGPDGSMLSVPLRPWSRQ